MRKACEGVLSKLEIHGDSHGVPTIGDVAEIMVNRIKALTSENERLREVLRLVLRRRRQAAVQKMAGKGFVRCKAQAALQHGRQG